LPVHLVETRKKRLSSLLAGVRRGVRGNELWFLGLALFVGLLSGALASVLSAAAHLMQRYLYGLEPDGRLSALDTLGPSTLLILPLGGAVVGLASWLFNRWSSRPIDVIEANALHGGRIPLLDSLVVSGETVLSNGFGASVGLEASYAQIGGGAASLIGQWFRLRRNDLRTLVGAGAGAAVGAAFGAPLTGAFYAFEIVIGAYTPASIAPVAAAALAAVAAARYLGVTPYLITAPSNGDVNAVQSVYFILLGLLCAATGIGIIRLVTLIEGKVRQTAIPPFWRPFIGGLLLMPIAWVSPRVLSAGHGALHIFISADETLGALVLLFAMKTLASTISLGFRFRGGLFFAALFLGALLGKIYALGLAMIAGGEVVAPLNSALVGMAALSVAIVGGPMTMSFLVLEATNDYGLTSIVIAVVLCSNILVRRFFGYSFSTWRLHLRGETIMSGRDIGWLRQLTAGVMMRRDPATIDEASTIAQFRALYPLGSTSRVILVDHGSRYAGIVPTGAAHDKELNPEKSISELATMKSRFLSPSMHIGEVIHAFDDSEADDLAVLFPDGQVAGVLTEKFVRRRYAEELERSQRELFGER
jgi:chloride channel protein, CIC family